MEIINNKNNKIIWSHDPSGNVFLRDGLIFRQINNSYRINYDYLMRSGLYKRLVDEGLLIPHEEIHEPKEGAGEVYKIIKPEQICFVSYPYEWCFSQLKAAALATIKIQKIALEFGMFLKDSSAFNIQFRGADPVLIDTLSFEKYREGQPWIAYRQFCEHFIAPLALMSYKDARLVTLFRTHHDGIPLDLASAILSARTYFNLELLFHLHFHAKMQRVFSNRPARKKRPVMSRFALNSLIDNLEFAVRKLKYKGAAGSIGAYYKNAPYSEEGMRHKKQIVAEFLDKIKPGVLWDFGANTGVFSRLAAGKGIRVVSFDSDHLAVEENYLSCLKNKEARILSLYIDIVNYSPILGWAPEEKMFFKEHGPVDAVLVLALIHHLAIAHSIPLDVIANFLGEICACLIIEFIPKEDLMAQKMLEVRENIFQNYTQENFEKTFREFFTILSAVKIKDSGRILYLMKKENN